MASRDESPADKPVGSITKNDRESIVVALRAFKGHRFVDVRIYATRPDGEKVPTAKGLTLKPDALPQLADLLRTAHATAREEGWCDGDAPTGGRR